MRNQVDLLATVTVLGVLEQAYFALQVIYARRKYKISPPETTGHPEFERIFRAQANCSEYFPIFVSLLWVAGIFFHQDGPRSTPTPACVKLLVAAALVSGQEERFDGGGSPRSSTGAQPTPHAASLGQ
ncbi:PREDICTED: leukotriene C4 synthase, partial [Phaethon lepturus]|uniref:leukotriene C4 synthase n=1 Tax=Phaethon lepturus TaxID=97097 RepID=UPI0005307E67